MRTNNGHEKRTRSRKTACKKEYREDSGQAGNPGESGEYFSEIDILSPLTSSPGTVERGDQVKSIV